MLKKLSAEFLGSLLLASSVVGSGIMATTLTQDIAIQLFVNTITTVFMLFVIITLFSSISGAHFNPLVTIVELFYKRVTFQEAALFVVSQIIGTSVGVVVANLMFNRPAIEESTFTRSGSYFFLAEVVATAGLILSILLLRHQNKGSMAAVIVPAWIGAAYIFTSSTSFANPAITFARSLSDSFAGISIKSVPMFILAQCLGAVLGVLLAAMLTTEKKEEDVFA
jgi:glycerol uptake facilitator-like aquaporin